MTNRIYANPLAQPSDLDRWRLEGEGKIIFPNGRLRLEGTRDPGPDTNQAANQRANLVFWCPVAFPDNIVIFGTSGPCRNRACASSSLRRVGKMEKFDSGLAPRSGPYDQYHHGDINALHLSYFRQRYVTERRFRTCNLRKSHGFHMVAQGANPIDACAPARSISFDPSPSRPARPRAGS